MSPTTVTGSPNAAFADAVFRVLSTDATLLALVTGVYASAPDAAKLVKPYVIVGDRDFAPQDAGAMQLEGGRARVTLDVWSDYNGPAETQDIQSRIRVLLLRASLPVQGFALFAGSVICEDEQCVADWDPDMPKQSLFHGVQAWIGLLEELG